MMAFSGNENLSVGFCYQDPSTGSIESFSISDFSGSDHSPIYFTTAGTGLPSALYLLGVCVANPTADVTASVNGFFVIA